MARYSKAELGSRTKSSSSGLSLLAALSQLPRKQRLRVNPRQVCKFHVSDSESPPRALLQHDTWRGLRGCAPLQVPPCWLSGEGRPAALEMRLGTPKLRLTNCSRVVRHGVASIGIAAGSCTQRNSCLRHELARSGTKATACGIPLEANGVAEVGGSTPLAPTIFGVRCLTPCCCSATAECRTKPVTRGAHIRLLPHGKETETGQPRELAPRREPRHRKAPAV